MSQQPAMPTFRKDRLGGLMVVLQFSLIAGLGWVAAPPFLAGSASPLCWAIEACAAALGLWALACNRPGNFNIRPTPRAGGVLIKGGPYRWVRHPMYSAVILYGCGCAVSAPTPWSWLGIAALIFVLTIKSSLEERWMLVEHPEYADYRVHTWRFMPGF